MTNLNNILVYKRTHTGDPNEKGEFGVHDCMGKVRDFKYNAVIGVGGIGLEPSHHGIDGKVTWVGVERLANDVPKVQGSRASIVTFKKYVVLDHTGPNLAEKAPALAKRLYNQGARFVLTSLSTTEYQEALTLIDVCLALPSLTTVRDNCGNQGCNHCKTVKTNVCSPIC